MTYARNFGRRTQLIFWREWFWKVGLWPNPPVLVNGKPWRLFRYYRLGFIEVRCWLEDFPQKGRER